MKRRKSAAKRRTTLTLPVTALRHAERVARDRNVNVSTVVGEVLERDRRTYADGERRKAAWDAYCESRRRLTEEQLMVLDGIILSPANR